MRAESNLEAGRRRKAAGGSLAPRRNLTEMADEFGISTIKLVHLLRMENGPECCFETRKSSNGVARRWFSQSEMRKWWKEINGGKP